MIFISAKFCRILCFFSELKLKSDIIAKFQENSIDTHTWEWFTGKCLRIMSKQWMRLYVFIYWQCVFETMCDKTNISVSACCGFERVDWTLNQSYFSVQGKQQLYRHECNFMGIFRSFSLFYIYVWRLAIGYNDNDDKNATLEAPHIYNR